MRGLLRWTFYGVAAFLLTVVLGLVITVLVLGDIGVD